MSFRTLILLAIAYVAGPRPSAPPPIIKAHRK
jgi:hypothetical protein